MMAGDETLDRLVADVLADTAVIAAADQLNAAWAGLPAGQDPAVFIQRQVAAIQVVAAVAIHHYFESDGQ